LQRLKNDFRNSSNIVLLIKNKRGKTALSLAIESFLPAAVEVILEKGLNPCQKPWETVEDVQKWVDEKSFYLSPLENKGRIEKLNRIRSLFKTFLEKNNRERLAVGSSQLIRIFDVKTGECEQTVEGHTVLAIAFSLDGQFLATGNHDQTVIIWNLDQKQCEKVMHFPIRHILSIIFNPDGKKVIVSGFDTLASWDWTSDEQHKILIHGDILTPLCFLNESVCLIERRRYSSNLLEYVLFDSDSGIQLKTFCIARGKVSLITPYTEKIYTWNNSQAQTLPLPLQMLNISDETWHTIFQIECDERFHQSRKSSCLMDKLRISNNHQKILGMVHAFHHYLGSKEYHRFTLYLWDCKTGVYKKLKEISPSSKGDVGLRPRINPQGTKAAFLESYYTRGKHKTKLTLFSNLDADAIQERVLIDDETASGCIEFSYSLYAYLEHQSFFEPRSVT